MTLYILTYGTILWSHDLPEEAHCGVNICTFQTRLPLGEYIWAVAGVFGDGVVGPFLPEPIFEVVEFYLPDPVRTISPQKGDIFERNTVVFKWYPANHTDYYVLTISEELSFEIPAETACSSQFSEACSYQVTLENGEYAWSIYGVNEHGAGPASESIWFSVLVPNRNE
jgi:hypothetical protein